MRFVVVAGLSGAGKSQAMKSFEDLGYYCIDNLPPSLALELVELARSAGVEQLALSLEMRKQGPFGDPMTALQRLRERGFNFDVLYLEASDDALLRRFSETRRRHPLDGSGALGDAIARERAELLAVRSVATHVLDTTQLTLAELKAQIALAFGDEASLPELTVRVVTFGFKFGLPLDADLVFDVRFLPNPYYVPELKDRCGTDEPVAAFLEAQPETRGFLQRLEALLDFLVPLYVLEGKARLTIAFGCTGGRHRSVFIAERIAQHLRGHERLKVALEHRELAPA
jgi:RNase adapter protein RapZ